MSTLPPEINNNVDWALEVLSHCINRHATKSHLKYLDWQSNLYWVWDQLGLKTTKGLNFKNISDKKVTHLYDCFCSIEKSIVSILEDMYEPVKPIPTQGELF